MESIWIDSLEVNSKEFYTLVRASKQTKTLFISYNKFTINSEFDFGEMRNCKIELLKLVTTIRFPMIWISMEVTYFGFSQLFSCFKI